MTKTTSEPQAIIRMADLKAAVRDLRALPVGAAHLTVLNTLTRSLGLGKSFGAALKAAGDGTLRSGHLPADPSPAWIDPKVALEPEADSLALWRLESGSYLVQPLGQAAPVGATRIRIMASFQPQAWIKDYAYDTDAEGEQDYDVTHEVLQEDLEGLKNWDNSPSWVDDLRAARCAPRWVRDWSGPFEIGFEEVFIIDDLVSWIEDGLVTRS